MEYEQTSLDGTTLSMDDVIENFTDRIIDSLPKDGSLRHKKFKPKPDDDITAGHCYVMAEAMAWLLETELNLKMPKDFGLRYTRIIVDGQEVTHFFLIMKNGVIVDPSKRQFEGKDIVVDYSKAFATSFRGQVSNRAKILIENLKLE